MNITSDTADRMAETIQRSLAETREAHLSDSLETLREVEEADERIIEVRKADRPPTISLPFNRNASTGAEEGKSEASSPPSSRVSADDGPITNNPLLPFLPVNQQSGVPSLSINIPMEDLNTNSTSENDNVILDSMEDFSIGVIIMHKSCQILMVIMSAILLFAGILLLTIHFTADTQTNSLGIGGPVLLLIGIFMIILSVILYLKVWRNRDKKISESRERYLHLGEEEQKRNSLSELNNFSNELRPRPIHMKRKSSMMVSQARNVLDSNFSSLERIAGHGRRGGSLQTLQVPDIFVTEPSPPVSGHLHRKHSKVSPSVTRKESSHKHGGHHGKQHGHGQGQEDGHHHGRKNRLPSQQTPNTGQSRSTPVTPARKPSVVTQELPNTRRFSFHGDDLLADGEISLPPVEFNEDDLHHHI